MTYLSLPAGLAARPTILGGIPTDLRAVLPSALFARGMEARTTTTTFAWSPISVAADDGVAVIKPNDIAPLDPGRWLLAPATTAPPGSGELHFTLSGEYSGAVVPAFFDPPYIAVVGFTVALVQIARRTAGFAGITNVDVLKNGVTILAAPPLQVSAAMGDNVSFSSNSFVLGQDIFLPTDRLDVVLTTVEMFDPGPPAGPEGLRVVITRI